MNGTSAAKIRSLERRRQAIELRREGRTYREIAEVMGISRARANKIVTEELEQIAKELLDEAKQFRALELERLEVVNQRLWAYVHAGSLDAIDRFLRLSARRSALLGLDSPTKVAPVTPNGDEEYTAGGGLSGLLAQLRGAE